MPPSFPVDREMVVEIVAAFRFRIFGVEIEGQALIVLFGGIHPEIKMRVGGKVFRHFGGEQCRIFRKVFPAGDLRVWGEAWRQRDGAWAVDGLHAVPGRLLEIS